ncbi:MAG TPA: sodium-dependent transporter [Planctomycetaceae bacterium]|nr:sodium-dependent transporter [Planctomycetaceae bacterium]
MTHYHRPTFGSRLGAILAAVGSAVGLGNIWRFPYEAGQNGGGAFLVIYLLCVLFLGIPVMLAEFFMGRHTRRNAVGAYQQLEPRSPWGLVGYMGILGAFMILGFYTVVAGWTFEYFYRAACQIVFGAEEAGTAARFGEEFNLFIASPWRPIVCAAILIAGTHAVILSGIKRGIELSAKVMMPLLFLLMIALCIRSATLPGAAEGLDFLFKPDFGKVGSRTVLGALGQAFFSLSLGMGCMITYASYFGKNANMQATAVSVAAIDTCVALLAGVIIFPAVFSFGIQPEAGPSLVFITLPNVFQQLPFGNIWAAVFFLLLLIAAVTSIISLHEVVTAYFHDEFAMSRAKAALVVSLGIFVLAVFSSLSCGLLGGYTLFGMNFFDFLDKTTSQILMPLGGMLVCIFVGWRIDRRILKSEFTNRGTVAFYFFSIYVFVLRFIAPLGIAAIFCDQLGLIARLSGQR